MVVLSIYCKNNDATVTVALPMDNPIVCSRALLCENYKYYTVQTQIQATYLHGAKNGLPLYPLLMLSTRVPVPVSCVALHKIQARIVVLCLLGLKLALAFQVGSTACPVALGLLELYLLPFTAELSVVCTTYYHTARLCTVLCNTQHCNCKVISDFGGLHDRSAPLQRCTS